MGTDCLRLFNKGLADKILLAKGDELSFLVEQQLNKLKEKGAIGVSSFLYDIEKGITVKESIERYTANIQRFQPENPSFKELIEIARVYVGLSAEIENLILDLCLSKDWVNLDYYGCIDEVFNTYEPDGSIPIKEIFPCDEEPLYTFLQPHHIDKIIESLTEHGNDLQIDCINDVKALRDYCAKNPDFMVAYEIDL